MSDVEHLTRYVSHQLETFFPSFGTDDIVTAEDVVEAEKKATVCLSHLKVFRDFDSLNSRDYTTFLYFLSRRVAQAAKNKLASRIFLLNKALNGIDLFYEIEMPDIFLIGHSVGMVFAKATYADYAVFFQGCTVGRHDEARPTLEKGVILFPGSSVIGKCLVRENTVISTGVHLVNSDTPGNCLVFEGKSGKPTFKETSEYYVDRYFRRGA